MPWGVYRWRPRYAFRVKAYRTLGVWGPVLIAAGCAGSSDPTSTVAANEIDGAVGNGVESGIAADSDGGAMPPLAADGGAADGRAADGAGAAPPVVSTATIHYLGRFDTRDPAGPRFAWPGSAIAATFTGTGLQATLSDTGTNYFDVVVDGGAPVIISTSGASKKYALASKLASGEHTLVFTKRTEANQGVVQLLALTPQGGGALVASPEPFTRRIEYIGDSITCGYGVLGVGPSCTFSADTEDESVAYGGLAAAALKAQQTVIAYSGKGVYRAYGGMMTDQMPTLFGLTLPDDATSTWGFTTPAPDVVVISLGTNDFSGGDPGAGFEQAYEAFLRQVREVYPKAYLVCDMSPMFDAPSRAAAEGYVTTAMAKLQNAGDTRVTSLTIAGADGGPTWGFETQNASDGYGCDYHPSQSTQLRMGQELTAALRQLLGW
jgi:lysophospholipase L1-like esterase